MNKDTSQKIKSRVKEEIERNLENGNFALRGYENEQVFALKMTEIKHIIKSEEARGEE